MFPSSDSEAPSYGDSDTEDEDTVSDHILDLQAGHSSYIANAVYGREIQQGHTGLAVRQEQFRKISILWHRLFGFGKADGGVSRKGRLDLFAAEKHTVRQQRLERLRQADLCGLLRQLLQNPDAAFRGN